MKSRRPSLPATTAALSTVSAIHYLYNGHQRRCYDRVQGIPSSVTSF